MNMQNPGLFKSFLIALGVLAVIALFVTGLGIIQLPNWPFIYFLFAFTGLAKVTKQGWVDTFVGAGIGLLVGLSSTIIGQFLGAAIGTVVMLVLVILLITGLVSGKFKYANVPCMFTLTAISAFIFTTPYAAVGGILLSFLIAAALFGVLVLVLASAGKKKATNETTITN